MTGKSKHMYCLSEEEWWDLRANFWKTIKTFRKLKS
jgi:hypothetical protein